MIINYHIHDMRKDSNCILIYLDTNKIAEPLSIISSLGFETRDKKRGWAWFIEPSYWTVKVEK